MASNGMEYADPGRRNLISDSDKSEFNESVTTSGAGSDLDGLDANFRYCSDVIPTTAELFRGSLSNLTFKIVFNNNKTMLHAHFARW